MIRSHLSGQIQLFVTPYESLVGAKCHAMRLLRRVFCRENKGGTNEDGRTKCGSQRGQHILWVARWCHSRRIDKICLSLIFFPSDSFFTPLRGAKDPCLFSSKYTRWTHHPLEWTKNSKIYPERKCEKTVWEFLMNCLTSGQFTGSLVVVKFVTSIPRESSFAWVVMQFNNTGHERRRENDF